jgi:DNA replicative helicase MCM subunit Mcm2 (Cdc46/Mcm family)
MRLLLAILSVFTRQEAADAAPFSPKQMQRHIRYARAINPTFVSASQKKIVECYRLLRQQDIIGVGKTATVSLHVNLRQNQPF